LNAWITSRAVSSSAPTSRAIAGTGVPDADADADDQDPADPDRAMLTAPHDLLQPTPLILGQAPSPNRFSHHTSLSRNRETETVINRDGTRGSTPSVSAAGERSWSTH
jgi:hypothetical protein